MSFQIFKIILENCCLIINGETVLMCYIYLCWYHDSFVSMECSLMIPKMDLQFMIHGFQCLICSEEAAVSTEAAPAAAPAPVPALGEPMDVTTALQLVLRKSLAHGGLVRGLHEAAKVIEKHAAQLCVLAEDCDQQDYVKLVKALCADHNVNMLTVPSAKTLGEWAGVSGVYF